MSLLNRSVGIKKISALFYRYRNEVDIFTEDNNKSKEFYSRLFDRLLEKKIIINDIQPLGDKKKVIETCRKSGTNSRKEVFIIDGDVDIINGKTEKLDKLFVLDKYCIENYLIDEESACSFIYSQCGIKSKGDIKKELDFYNWLAYCRDELMELFILFSVFSSIDKPYELHSAERFIVSLGSSKGMVIDITQVKKHCENLKNEILKFLSPDQFERIFNKTSKKWTKNHNNFFTIVSGKDYLLPLLNYKSQVFKKSKALPSKEEIKINLVENFDVKSLNDLRNFILTS